MIAVFLVLLVAGHTSKGAQSWFNLGFFRIQPSEFGKVVFALVLAELCAKIPPNDLKGIAAAVGVSGVMIVLIMLQPDLGSALVHSVMLFAVLIVAGAPVKFLLGMIGCGMAALPLGWLVLKPYQRLRLMVFIDPTVDPQGAGYNVIQSRIAVGSGGLWGKGFLQGTQGKPPVLKLKPAGPNSAGGGEDKRGAHNVGPPTPDSANSQKNKNRTNHGFLAAGMEK